MRENGADVSDFHDAFESLIESLEAIFENEVLVDLPFNLVHSLVNQINKTVQACSQFQNNRNQQQFQAAIQQVESLRTNLQTWGLTSLSILGSDVQRKVSQINEELNAAIAKRAEVEQLKSNVESLIQPAVSGSLSKAFSDRKNALEGKESKWFWTSVISASIAVVATIVIVLSIVGFFEGASAGPDELESTKNGILWSTIALRLGILLPIYSIFGLAFAQYAKERFSAHQHPKYRLKVQGAHLQRELISLTT